MFCSGSLSFLEQTMNKKSFIRKATSILLLFTMMITVLPAIEGTLEVSAASYLKTLSASASGQHQASLSWNALTKKQKKKVKGITVFRDGVAIANISKGATSFTDSGLAAGSTYTYQVKTYKTKVKKTKMWYNKATGQYQKKKPAKKIRGKRKTFKKVTYKYSNASPARSITTAAPPAPAVTVPVPQNLSVTVEGTDLKIQWSPVEGATGYYVYVDNNTFDANATIASDGLKKKKITGVPAGTHTVQVAAIIGSAVSAKSSAVTVTVNSPDEESRDVTDYLGTTRHIVKKTDSTGTVYWEDEDQGTYLESDLAKIDRTVDGEFANSGGTVMWQSNGVTFVKKCLTNTSDLSAKIEMFNGDPAKLHFNYPNEIKSITTHNRNQEEVTKDFIMNGSELRLTEAPYTETTTGSQGKKIVNLIFQGETIGWGGTTGCGFTKGTVKVIVTYDGIGEIANWTFNINPDGIAVDSGRGAEIYLTPLRKQYWDIAMAAIPNIKTGDYDRDMNTVAKYVEDNYPYSQIKCTEGRFLLETYSVCAYGVYGFDGLGQYSGDYYEGDTYDSQHSAFHLDSNPTKWYQTNGYYE